MKDLLDFFRLDNDQIIKEQVNVLETIDLVLHNLSTKIKTQKAEIAILENTPKNIQADQKKLSQIFEYLLSNALRYLAEDRNPVIIISGEKTDKEFIFHIEVNDIGKQYPEEIFCKSRKLNPGDKALGADIGLAICSQLVDLHNGRIWLESNYKEGNIFSFAIPVKI